MSGTGLSLLGTLNVHLQDVGLGLHHVRGVEAAGGGGLGLEGAGSRGQGAVSGEAALLHDGDDEVGSAPVALVYGCLQGGVEGGAVGLDAVAVVHLFDHVHDGGELVLADDGLGLLGGRRGDLVHQRVVRVQVGGAVGQVH